MLKSENVFQKIFSGIGFGNGRVPLRSNVFGKGGGGYNPIGTTGNSPMFSADRHSPLLGNAQPTKRISGYYERVAEIRGYELLDISKLAISVFRDYVNNFLNISASQVVTIQDEEGVNDDVKTERINDILTNDIKIFDFIRDHLDETIFYGTYYSMLQTDRDEKGHTRFHVYGLHDPIAVVIKKHRTESGTIEEEFIARGSDGNTYIIPSTECFYLGSPSLRLINDLADGYSDSSEKAIPRPGEQKNRDKVIEKESYYAGEPLFYSTVLKVKELVVKEILVSLLSIRDLSSPSMYGLAIDKGVPLENANELCAKMQKLSANYSELSSFLTAQFDVTSLIESTLSQNVKFFPDYNATLQNKGLLNLDKLSDKLLEIMQNVDQCKQNVLSPLGIPLTMIDNTSGSKWAVLQQSERLNSRVNFIMSGIIDSVTSLVRTIYKTVYQEDIDPAQIKLHILEKSTVTYNNQINQAESISSLLTGISNVITTSLQTMELAGPLIDTEKYLSYIQNLIKDIDPNTDSLITEETIEKYKRLAELKISAQLEQLGGEPGGM